jgi:hypothetical protein
MESQVLTFAELIEVVRTCEVIELPGGTPPYLQEFIARRLENTFPEIADKIRRFDQGRMHRLCLYIKETHYLTR